MEQRFGGNGDIPTQATCHGMGSLPVPMGCPLDINSRDFMITIEWRGLNA